MPTKQIIQKSLENIQGDEADLVIISVFYTKLAQTYVYRPNGRNALNVAITRAQDKDINEHINSFNYIKNNNIFLK